MSQGFFLPAQLPIPALPTDRLCAAMVRILPKTTLVLDMAPNAEDARNRARNEALPDGSECWYRFFTAEDASNINDPEFAMGMVHHEFARMVKSGAKFPASVPLDGGGSGFAITSRGHVLTNYHLVTAEISNYQRGSGAVGTDVLCKSLRAQVARRNSDGSWEWYDAKSLWLVSNPPSARALWQDEMGSFHPREDTALLRVDPPPSAHLELSERVAGVSERVWMAGFPLRSARSKESLESIGYSDADGTLRVSAGKITEADADDYFTSDLDGSMGNSGSPVFDSAGLVVGMFSRASGNGPRNAFEYGHMSRVHVSTKLAVEGLSLAAVLKSGG